MQIPNLRSSYEMGVMLVKHYGPVLKLQGLFAERITAL